ncbi:MAG: hypothetical protein H2174_10970 [Vampirovibrio sp.]|nr:hypothetical protein [Vampirovibrio sp.]
MMSVSLSATTTPASQATVAKKQSEARAGADLQAPATAQYAPLPTTPTDAFTPATLVPATTPTVGMLVDPNALPTDATAADAAPPKSGFDPIAGAVAVVSLVIAAGVLAFATKGEKGEYWKELPKLLLGGGLGVGATLLAPFGGNLIKDLLKKKPATPAEPQPDATLAAGMQPQVIASAPVIDGSLVPPAIDPMTGLPVATATVQQPAMMATSAIPAFTA